MATTVNVDRDLSEVFQTGSRIIGASAVQLFPGDAYPVAKGAQLKADADNMGTIYIGVKGVTAGTVAATDGFPLDASEGLHIPIDDLSRIYAIASTADQKLFFALL